MDIIEKLMLISFALATLFLVVVFQTIAISRLHKTLPWTVLAAGFVVIGGRMVWGLVRLPIALEQARAKGVLPDSLNWEQTINITLAFVGVSLWIAGFDILRRHYRRIGI